jgi:hypothetical protein
MATMLKSNTIGDFEDQDLESQIAMAQALRKQSLQTPGQMVGGFYVGKNPLLNLGEAVIGGMNEQVARGRQGSLSKARQQAEQDWLARQPSATTQQTKELAGPTEGGEPLIGTADVPKPYAQLQQEVNQWGVQAPATSPLGQQVRAHALTQALSLPEKQMMAEQRAEEAKQARLEKAVAAKEAVAAKAEADRVRDRERASDKESLVRLAASLKTSSGGTAAAGAPPLGKTQFKGFTPEGQQVIFSPTQSKNYIIGEDGTPSPYTGKIESQASVSKELGKEKEAGKNLTEIASIEKMVQDNPKAFSLAAGAASTMLPNIVGARVQSKMMTDAERQTRAAVLNKASRVIHELYGAALTRGEDVRAAPWAPKPDDDVETTLNKLAQAKAYAQQRVGKSAAGGSEEWVRDASGKLVRKP